MGRGVAGREGEVEGGKVGGRKGEREGGKRGGRDGGREEGKEGESRFHLLYLTIPLITKPTAWADRSLQSSSLKPFSVSSPVSTPSTPKLLIGRGSQTVAPTQRRVKPPEVETASPQPPSPRQMG